MNENATALEIRIIKTYFELKDETRQEISNHFTNYFKQKYNNIGKVINNNSSITINANENYIKHLEECTERGIYCLEFHRRYRKGYTKV